MLVVLSNGLAMGNELANTVMSLSELNCEICEIGGESFNHIAAALVQKGRGYTAT